MLRLKQLVEAYFRRRTALRVALLALIATIWGYSEYSDWYVIPESNLNYKAIREIRENYREGPLTFAVVGDNKNSPIFDTVIQRINQDKDIQFVVLLGDLVQYPTVETYRAFLAQRDDLHPPSVAVPGNHDVAFKNHYFYHTIFGRFYYSFAVGDSLFIMLDDSNEQRIDDEQFAWLRDQLQRGQNYKNRFVFMHVPLWDPRGVDERGVRFAHALGDSDAARELETLFRKNAVTLLFEGHIHAYYNLKDSQPPRIITGGGGAALSGTDPQHAFHHYLKVTVDKEGAATSVVKLDQTGHVRSWQQYLTNAKLYISTFVHLYTLQLILGLLVLLLLADIGSEFLRQRKEHDQQNAR